MGNQPLIKQQELCCSQDLKSQNSLRRNTFPFANSTKKFQLNTTKIHSDYILFYPAIGKGSFGSVYKAISRSTNIVRAVKRIHKKDSSKALQELEEILILKKLDHPNIIRIHEIYVEEVFIYIVMEFCSGGELFDRIIAKQTITENEAKFYTKQLLSAIGYCHSSNIMHRDLKPQNIMFLSENSKDLKIIDFGAGTTFKEGIPLTSKIGSVYYIAPEVIKKNYCQKCDIWSIGVILYIMLSGSPPFNAKTEKGIYDKILEGKVNFPPSKWKKVSKEARDLILSMLEYDPKDRISTRHALMHPWIVSATKEGDTNLYIANQMSAMKEFTHINKFQSAVSCFISYNLVEAKSLSKLQDKFKQIDVNSDGKISWKEFRECYLENMPPTSEEELTEIFQKLDQNNSGFIDYTQFLSSALHKNYEENDQILTKAFNLIDKDGDGLLDEQELALAFGNESSGNSMVYKQMIKEADLNGDKKISRSEFKIAMKNMDINNAPTQ